MKIGYRGKVAAFVLAATSLAGCAGYELRSDGTDSGTYLRPRHAQGSVLRQEQAQQFTEDACVICPDVQSNGYVHEDGRLQAEHADAVRSERFLTEIGAHATRVAQTSAHYRAEASTTFHNFRTDHETFLQDTASELVGREVGKYTDSLKGMNEQVKSTLDKARESHSRWKQELEKKLNQEGK